ncbi:MAG: STAS domain-containing protein [Tepidisphaeraceae bacterium]
MQIDRQAHGAVTVLRPAGPLTGADVDQFRTVATDASRANMGRVVVDGSAVAFVDSAGIEALADVAEALGNTGHALKIACANATLRETLDLTGWSSSFDFFNDVNEAVRSFL